MASLLTGRGITAAQAANVQNNPQAMQTLRSAGVLRGVEPGAEKLQDIRQAVIDYATQQTQNNQQADEQISQEPVQNLQEPTQKRTVPPLPRQATQEQQERVSTPPLPQRAQNAAQRTTADTLRIRAQEETKAPPMPPLTVGSRNDIVNENRQEGNNGRQAQNPTQSFIDRARSAGTAARQNAVGDQRTSSVGRFLENLRNRAELYSQGREAVSIRNQAEARNWEQVSAKEIGMAKGTDAKTVRVAPDSALNRQQMEAKQLYADMGVNLHFVQGQFETEDIYAKGTHAGEHVTARAWISADKKDIWVQMDHPTLTWNQLLDHEETHRRIQEEPGYKETIMEALLADKELVPFLSQIIDSYSEAYATVGMRDSEDVIEEMLADYRAGFNMLDPEGKNARTYSVAKSARKDILQAEEQQRLGFGGTRQNGTGGRAAASTEIGYQEGEQYGFGPEEGRTVREEPQVSGGLEESTGAVREASAGGAGTLTQTSGGVHKGSNSQWQDRLKTAAITPKQGSLEQAFTERALAQYGIKTNTLPANAYNAEFRRANPDIKDEEIPCMFCVGGEIYLREGITKEEAAVGIPHESNHAMWELGYEPYSAILKEAPDYLNLDYTDTLTVLDALLEHVNRQFKDLGKDETINKLFDEALSVVYGKAVTGTLRGSGKLPNVDYGKLFNNFDELIQRLDEAHKGFETWNKNRQSEKESAEAKVGIYVDSKTESANPGNFSIETWNASDYVQNSAAAAADLAEQLGVSNRQAKKYISDINSIAKIIANDRVRLDYTPSPNRSSFIGNTEYGGSIDFSTICKKRRLYTGTIEAIQKALPNTAITADELLNIRAMMKERGYEVSCGLCYVEGSRVKIGEYTQQFLDELKGTGMYVPTMAEMNTSDGQEQIRAEHPEVYEQYVKFMNKLAQRKPKLFQMATEYQGEILKKFKNDGTVDQKNRNGGLRLQSFSDFEIIHLIDTMQVIMDMSRVGLAGQAYTKVPDFAWALGDTGLKINLSLIAKGVDENGHIILDEVEGMKRADAEALRNAYSKNVGTILVTFNDEQLKAAMADPFIDFIIPFHRSQWSKAQYDAIGLPKGTKDYTDQQNESYVEKVYNANGKPQRPANYMPNNYWDFNKSGKENAEAYLRMCAENNRTPKFYKLLVDNGDGSFSLQKDGSTDGYWKLLSDFKMYDNAGKGSPQLPVKPKFNMEQAERMLNEYTGGHQRFPVAQDVVDDFLKGKQAGKASTEIDADYLAAVESGDMETAQRMVDEAAKKAGYTVEGYHGTRAFGFTQIDTGMSDDNLSFFVTSDINTARTYSTRRDVRRIGDKDYAATTDFDIISDLQKEATEAGIDFGTVLSSMAGIQGWGDIDSINKRLSGIAEMASQGFDIDTVKEQIWTVLDQWTWDLFDTIRGNQDGSVDEYDEWIESDDTQQLHDSLDNIASAYVSYAEALADDNIEEKAGNYHVFINPDGLFEIDCKGRKWNQIEGTGPLSETNGGRLWTTRTISQWAKANNYTGVKFHNLIDDGGYGGKRVSVPTDVYSLFEPNRQVKSADPVTYDDNGNIIPLSERFNPENNDIRYSTEISDEDLDEAVYEEMSASMRDIMRRLQEDVDRAKEPEQKPEPKKKAQRASDEEYMAAMDNGRIADAQRLVRETADAAMPKSKVRSASTGELRYVYHYTNKNFYEFRPMDQSAGSNRTLGDGYYVSTSETEFKNFGKNKMVLFANITNPFEMSLTKKQAQTIYDKYFRPLHPNDIGKTYEDHVLSKLQIESRVFDYLKEAAEKNGTTTSKILTDLGFDGVHDGVEWVAFKPEQLKSADVATYNDDGQMIPLSERFNPKEKDTRYSIEIDPEVAAQFSPEAIARRQSNRTKGVKGERKVSRVRSNTYEYSGLYNEVEAQMDEADEENYTYDPVSEKKSMNEALGRLKADFDGEVSRLSEADRQWGGSDLDTAMGILHRYRTEGRATGDYGDFWRWSKVIQEKGTKGGQFIQAFAKYTRTGTGAAMKGAKDIHDRFKLNPAQQKQVDAAKKKLMDGIDSDMNGAAQDAMKQAKGQKEPGKKQDGKVDKKKLDAEVQRRKDAERLVREISKLFEKQQNHGEPVENWLNLTGEELARKIAGRFSEPKQRTKTTMQTILSDLVGFAEEHALPDRKKAEGTKRTAIDTITDYLNNRDAYGTAWAAAQSYLRAAYTDDQEKLDALNSFLTATIAYNAEGTDRTMLDAILQSADVLGISEKRILELTSAGATASTIDRIGDELVNQVKERMGADYDESFTQQLKDAVRRHITGIALQESAEEQRLRLGGMTTDAARQLEINLQKLLTQSRGDKNRAAQSVADYLIRELGIPSSDAAIAAERITGAFMDELASRADRKLQQMFAEKKPKTQEQRDRLLDLIRLGGLTNSNVEDAVVDALGIGGMSRERQRELVGVMAQFGETLDAMEADDLDGLKDLIRAQAAVRNTPLSRQAEKALAGETDAQYLREFALAQLDAIAGDFAEMSPGAKISTFQTISHLLNMRTALRNLTSNQVFDLVDSAANNLATIPDMVIGAFTGKRTVGVNKSWLSEMKRAGAKQGAARNALEVRLDVSPDDRQKSKYGTAGRRTNSMAASNAFGRILSHLEEVMGYELNTTDEFHKGSVRGETLESLARFVERGDITQEQANAWAEEEALYRSFQDDTLVGNIMGELKTLLNVIGFGDSGKTNSRGRTIHDFGLGDLVVKYTQVPGALIHRGIEYSPLGYAKMLYDLAIAKDSLVRTQKRGEDVTNAQRKLALDIGRATTGSGLITLFAVLAKAGLLRRDDDDKDKNAKAMHAAQGLSGTQLNLTALKRWIEGGDLSLTDGDVLADIGFLEPLDSLMTIATLMANDDDLKLTDIGVKSLDGVWKAISNTSAMQTISNIIQTVQYHDEENDLPLYFQIPIEIASDSISGFVPSPVRQLAQATDTTYRDQYRSKNLNDQIRARVANSIPGLRQTLAPKITPLGEDRKYQKPLLNYLNATLNPGNINVYQGSGVVDELNRVYGETDDAKIWPERNAPYSFTANDEKWTLTPDERTQYQRTRGQTTANAMDAVMGTDWYKSMGATDQAEVLNWIGNFSNFVAKKEMLESRGQEYGSTTYNKYYEAWQSGTPIEEVVADKYGKLVTAAAETAKAETIIAEAKIPDASKEEAETMSADAKRLYAAFLQGGVSDSTARNLATSMEGSEASGHEQWRMVYDAAGKEGEKAVTSVMTDDMKRNWNLAKDAGVSMDDYIKVREGFKDLNGNGNKSQDEWNATLDSFTFSTNAAKDKSIKGTLWQILTGSGSTKNNPYDKEAGQKVVDAKNGGGSGSGSYAPARIPTLRIPAAPTVSKPSSGLRIRAATPAALAPRSGLRIKAQ